MLKISMCLFRKAEQIKKLAPTTDKLFAIMADAKTQTSVHRNKQ